MKTLSFIITTVVIIFSFQQLNGQCFDGDCTNGKGKYFLNETQIYAGHFQNGLLHGKGIIIDDEGILTYGYWVQGVQQGKAILKFPDGTKIFCNVEDNMLNGKSYIKDENGNVSTYIYWIDGELVGYEINEQYEGVSQNQNIQL